MARYVCSLEEFLAEVAPQIQDKLFSVKASRGPLCVQAGGISVRIKTTSVFVKGFTWFVMCVGWRSF